MIKVVLVWTNEGIVCCDCQGSPHKKCILWIANNSPVVAMKLFQWFFAKISKMRWDGNIKCIAREYNLIKFLFSHKSVCPLNLLCLGIKCISYCGSWKNDVKISVKQEVGVEQSSKRKVTLQYVERKLGQGWKMTRQEPTVRKWLIWMHVREWAGRLKNNPMKTF